MITTGMRLKTSLKSIKNSALVMLTEQTRLISAQAAPVDSDGRTNTRKRSEIQLVSLECPFNMLCGERNHLKLKKLNFYLLKSLSF